MIKPLTPLLIIALLILSACSRQNVQTESTESAKSIDSQMSPGKDETPAPDSQNVPPMTTIKSGKDLNLVRVMEGGACKNKQMGISGLFLLYANTNDIEHIQEAQGPEVFSHFSEAIETFSMVSIQKAVYQTDFSRSSSVDSQANQHDIFNQVSQYFRIAIEDPIISFQNETSLTIDIIPFTRSFILHSQDCEEALSHAD